MRITAEDIILAHTVPRVAGNACCRKEDTKDERHRVTEREKMNACEMVPVRSYNCDPTFIFY